MDKKNDETHLHLRALWPQIIAFEHLFLGETSPGVPEPVLCDTYINISNLLGTTTGHRFAYPCPPPPSPCRGVPLS